MEVVSLIRGKTVRTVHTVRFSFKSGGQYVTGHTLLSAKPSAVILKLIRGCGGQ